MGVGQWMKVLGTVTTLAQVGAQFRKPTDLSQGLGGGTSLEHRLAGVVVAALKEAFDRDRARMDLERETLDAERSRAERALQAELRRQAADRALNQIKLIAVFAGLVPGALDPDAFTIGRFASDAEDRILYEASTGHLFFDRDGTGPAEAQYFAAMSDGLNLTASDFIVI